MSGDRFGRPWSPRPAAASAPPVSILVVCKDAAATLERCLASLRSLDYPNLEIVVQDGASSDRTQRILAEHGDALDVVSAPDRDQNEAFLRGLARCRGAFVGFCWADEELLPHAARRAVAALEADPRLAAVYGDLIETDAAGVEAGVIRYPEWSLERVHRYEFVPPVCASFFRRDRLEETFGRLAPLAPDCTEYLLWLSVGSRYAIAHVDEALARYARHPGQLSRRASRMATYAGRLETAIERLAAEPGLPALFREQRERAIANVWLWAAQWLHEACDASSEGRRALEQALGHDPDSAWLSTAIWSCLRFSLRRRDADAIEAWLATIERGGRRLVGHGYARALARLAAGDTTGARAAAAAAAGDPHIDALWRLAPSALRAAEEAGLLEAAVELLREIARSRSGQWLALSLVLGDIGRLDAAAAAVERHLAEVDTDETARLWAAQLEVELSARTGRARLELAGGRGEPASPEDAARAAALVWRLVCDPSLAASLGDPSRAAAARMVAAVRTGALERCRLDLARELASLSGRLTRPAQPGPPGC